MLPYQDLKTQNGGVVSGAHLFLQRRKERFVVGDNANLSGPRGTAFTGH